MKRLIVVTLALLMMSHAANAQSGKQPFSLPENSEQIDLWNSTMPDKNGTRGPEIINDKGSITHISTPQLIVHRPQHPNGTAILVISGGGYAHIELGKESHPTASWLQSQGITAFELIYRLPQEGWNTTSVPFEDAQRAVRLIRSMADQYGVNPHKIGVLGFSAGGHLAGITATLFNKKFYEPVDSIHYPQDRILQGSSILLFPCFRPITKPIR